ncbi:branched-chain amino acid transport system ATP-binding protein [Nocardioides terrae]|uniref:Branched-chain amino acid transport system ATP-binding protein n=1 Tax=Nocardioides terrae TaxID=574651 RepID=A0A1I1F304_9ACTN|nr:ABC transporter ATP-binding protein [Nocardioides terrae]SFB93336.1 branched-chain amino acid transport system ATP-binding protein [Nocardioides terrae]
MSLLRCTAVTKRFGGLKALDGVDLEVGAGEIVGLVGPNGSGKTTLLSTIAGSLPVSGGRIEFQGRDVTRLSSHRRAHAGIARTFQIPRPLGSFDVLGNVATAAMFGRDRVSRSEAIERAHGVLKRIGLDGHAGSDVTTLTLHEHKFLEIGRALALDPRLILLDEVLGGLNPAEAAAGMELIASLRDDGRSVIYIEHNVRAVTALADRMYVLDRGRNLFDGTPTEVVGDDRVVAAYLGGGARA